MEAVHHSPLSTIRRPAMPVSIVRLLAGWFPPAPSAPAAGPASGASTTLADLDATAMRDIGVPARRPSAREHAARLLMQAGHG